jgi:hypothetical protein
MRLLAALLIILASNVSYAEFCATPLVGKWSCDQDVLGKNIEILVAPSGHGLSHGAIIVLNQDLGKTVLTAPLDNTWTSSTDFYPVAAKCPGGSDATVVVEYKDRPVNYRKASGSFTFIFEYKEPYTDTRTLHIHDYTQFSDGSNYGTDATCYKTK